MIDTYGRDIYYLRLSVTERCNLRCRYCMPEEGICKKPHEEMMTEDEMIRAVEVAASLGFRKVRLTGGEPLVKKNILSICRRVADVPGIQEVCLTTNATLLPQMAQELRQAGVKRLNISLDTLVEEKYTYITRRGHLQEAMEGIEAAIAAGFEKIKINAVLIGGFNEDEIERLAELTVTCPVDVRFIELMPIGDSQEFGQDAMIPCEEVLRRLPKLQPCNHDGGVAALYRLPGAKGNVGLIRPISQHFCDTCNRMRLTSDGKLKPCLHSSREFSIKDLDRADMEAMFREAVQAKPARHGELSARHRSEAGRDMNQIGG